MKNRLQLITYVDRLSDGGLRELAKLLVGPHQGVSEASICSLFSAPLMQRTDPIDHTAVDPASVTE
jgi:sucrose phosphorylase